MKVVLLSRFLSNSNVQTQRADPVVRTVVAKEVAAPEGVVLVVALLAVALKEVEDVDLVVLGNKKYQVQKHSRIDDRIGQSEKE